MEVPKPDIARALAALAIPHKGGQFCAVWRGEANPSCSISKRDAGRWRDHATGHTGDACELVKLVRGCSFVEAAKWLQSANLSQYEPTPKQAPDGIENGTVLSTGNVSRALREYAKERGISGNTLLWALQVNYQRQTSQGLKNFFAIGIRTSGGGYAVRNKYTKQLVGAGGISCLGFLDTANVGVVVEGLFDALSFFELWPDVKAAVFVLNGTANASELITELQKRASQFTDLAYLSDLGTGSNAVLATLLAAGVKIRDARAALCGYKDLNELLTKRGKP